MANITKVYLLNTLLEKDYAHTMYFEDEAAQQVYFQKRIKPDLTFTDFSYQRKDHIIRIPKHIDSLYAAKVNYCMYQNAEYSNKWFYAFITDMKYIDDGRTDVYIQTDCIQTWMFDITVKHSFVEREHATTDEIGDHTIDEGLETGEFVVNGTLRFTYGSNLSVIVGVTKLVSGTESAAIGGTLYHGVYSGNHYFAFDHTAATALNDFVKAYDTAGVGDAIQCMFCAPDVLAASPADGKVHSGEWIPGSATPDSVVINKPFDTTTGWKKEITAQFSKTDIDGYTPRNKKLMCYPYRYLLVSNNAGNAATYKFERFYLTGSDGKKTLVEPAFSVYGVLTIGCSVRLLPLAYNGALVENEDEGLNMGKFPVLNWASDAYTNWLTQNSVNIGLQLATGAGQVIAGAAMTIGTGGVGAAVGGGQIVGGVSTIAGTLAQIHQQSFAPNQLRGNLNSGDVTTARGVNTFHFYTMSVKKEIAAILDEYFDMFGYKCNRVKIPAKNHRQSYWYTKTIDANIVGGIPQNDLQTIKDCYNRGITFWKNEEYYRNYSAPNAIVQEGEN